MNTEIKRADYLMRDAIMTLLSDAQIARVSMREGGPSLVEGDEYVDLTHLDQGVRRVQATTVVPVRQALARSCVDDATWSKICARLTTAS